MIDSDGVVLDKKYQTTKDITDNVKGAARKLLLVPNSDTPIPRLEKIRQENIFTSVAYGLGIHASLL